MVGFKNHFIMETTTSWRPKNHTSTLGLQKMAAWITLDVFNILVSAPLVCENGCLLYLPSPSPVWRFPLMLISYHPKTKIKTRLKSNSCVTLLGTTCPCGELWLVETPLHQLQFATCVSCDQWCCTRIFLRLNSTGATLYPFFFFLFVENHPYLNRALNLRIY